mgnify:CR=1 FL=1
MYKKTEVCIMANKKELFNEAISTVPYNGMDPKTATEMVAEAMRNIAKRDYRDFTEDEIQATIIAGFETLKEAGQDFKIQTWIMK